MLAPEQLLAFLVAAILVTATPGPDNLMVLAVGMSRGRRHGIAFGLGCALGCLSHTALAVAGVSALLAASPLAFTVLRVAGGAYLIVLGVQALRSPGGVRVGEGGPPRAGEPTLAGLFVRGVVANAINPKVVLFFLSFLPQFVATDRGGVPAQMAALGIVFTLQAALLFGLLGFFAGHVGQWLTARPRAGLWLDRIAGTIFVGLGVRLIASR